MQKFVIVGGGLAGHRAALELRKLSPAISITIFSAEPGLPYDRPPLSKNFLLGSDEAQSVVLHQTDAYQALDISYLPSTPIKVIDRVGKRVLAADDRWFEYDTLLLTTGSRARRLPASVGAGDTVHYLRTLEDAVRLRDALSPKRRVVIIGGGFIGLEVASTARARGCLVTVIEGRDRVLARGMPEILSNWVEGLHRANGVEIVHGATVESIAHDGKGALILLGQSSIPADVVVAGIGVVPNTELAVAAGLLVDDGIVVDRSCRTSDPAIFAAGEVTSHPTAGNGKHQRIESWKAASDQPAVAAKSMLGLEVAFTDVPWLWSDQFDANIQALGCPDQGHSHIVRGDPNARAWTFVSLDSEERPVGAVAVNNGRDISMLRRIMEKGGRLPP